MASIKPFGPTRGGLHVTQPTDHHVTWPVVRTLAGGIDCFEQTISAGSFQPLGPTITQVYAKKDGRSADSMDGRSPETAACGSSAVAAMLARFGKFAVTEGVDDHMRVTKGLGGSLLAGVEYLQSRGLEAQQRSGGTWEDLRRGLDGGFGVIVTLSHAESPHTLVVTGMYTDENGEAFIQVQDWLGVDMPMTFRRDEFEAGWEHASLGGLGGLKTGINRTFAFVGAHGATLPAGGSVLGTLGAYSSHVLLDGFHALTSGATYFGDGEVIGGSARFLGGVIEAVPQIPAGFMQLTGASLEWCGERLLAVTRRAQTVPQVMGATCLALMAGPLKVCGWVLRVLGQLLGLVVGACVRGAAYPLLKLSEVMHSDNDACNQVSYCNPAGSDREKRNYADLLASPASAKIELIQAMLHGRVGERERRMIDRVMAAATQEQRGQIVAYFGAALPSARR